MPFSVLAPLISRKMDLPHPEGLSNPWPGIFPYGMPAHLAFLPLVTRGLFKTASPADYFFLSNVQGFLQNLSPFSLRATPCLY